MVLSLGLLLGCADSRPLPHGTTESPTSAAHDAAVSGDDCESFQTQADELLAQGQACQQDDDCAFMTIDADCLRAFLCPPALSRTADLEHVRDEAARLSSAYRACTSSCAVANCVDFPGIMCNPWTHLCEGRLIRR
jgi:hypothetical protein